MDIHPEILDWPVVLEQDHLACASLSYAGGLLRPERCRGALGNGGTPGELLKRVQAHAEAVHGWTSGNWVPAEQLLTEERARTAQARADERVARRMARGQQDGPEMHVSRSEVSKLVAVLDRMRQQAPDDMPLRPELEEARRYFGTRLRGGWHTADTARPSDADTAQMSDAEPRSLRKDLVSALRKVRESQDAIALKDSASGPRWLTAHLLREMLDELLRELDGDRA